MQTCGGNGGLTIASKTNTHTTRRKDLQAIHYVSISSCSCTHNEGALTEPSNYLSTVTGKNDAFSLKDWLNRHIWLSTLGDYIQSSQNVSKVTIPYFFINNVTALFKKIPRNICKKNRSFAWKLTFLGHSEYIIIFCGFLYPVHTVSHWQQHDLI